MYSCSRTAWNVYRYSLWKLTSCSAYLRLWCRGIVKRKFDEKHALTLWRMMCTVLNLLVWYSYIYGRTNLVLQYRLHTYSCAGTQKYSSKPMYYTKPLYTSKLCDLGSLYLGKYNTFICTTLFRAIKLNEFYCRKQNCTYKCIILADDEFKLGILVLEMTLGSSTETNLGHNNIKI